MTRRVCRDVGIPSDAVVLGSQLEDLSDDGLRAAVQGVSIFAKLNLPPPEDVSRRVVATLLFLEDERSTLLP